MRIKKIIKYLKSNRSKIKTIYEVVENVLRNLQDKGIMLLYFSLFKNILKIFIYLKNEFTLPRKKKLLRQFYAEYGLNVVTNTIPDVRDLFKM